LEEAAESDEDDDEEVEDGGSDAKKIKTETQTALREKVGGKVLRKKGNNTEVEDDDKMDVAEESDHNGEDKNVKDGDTDTNGSLGKRKSNDDDDDDDDDELSKAEVEPVDKKAMDDRPATEQPVKPTRPISFHAVPSFHEQDLARVRIIHQDLMNFSILEQAGQRLAEVTNEYNNGKNIESVEISRVCDLSIIFITHSF
jgi:hypothetical protein